MLPIVTASKLFYSSNSQILSSLPSLPIFLFLSSFRVIETIRCELYSSLFSALIFPSPFLLSVREKTLFYPSCVTGKRHKNRWVRSFTMAALHYYKSWPCAQAKEWREQEDTIGELKETDELISSWGKDFKGYSVRLRALGRSKTFKPRPELTTNRAYSGEWQPEIDRNAEQREIINETSVFLEF